MLTLTNYGLGSSKHRDPNSAKVLSKSLQIRNRAECLMKQCLKSQYKLTSDKRSEILDQISNYYSRIPFNVIIWNKYEVKQCIIDSILLLDGDFNPYKAREAFKLIETMLINLVHQPWHTEFRRIYTYSGLYRLSISEPLIGVEEVFKAAGFKEMPKDHMQLVLGDDRMPMVDESEGVFSVIFDCLVAQAVFTNIVEVFEHHCKASRLPEGVTSNRINAYCWIQAYFRERSHQTTERSCANIQELLNNIANHLVKLSDETATPSAPPTSASTPTLSVAAGPSRGAEKSRYPASNLTQSSSSSVTGFTTAIATGGRSSDSSLNQDKTINRAESHRFLAQTKPRNNNNNGININNNTNPNSKIQIDDLLRLSNDLLRLPQLGHLEPQSAGVERRIPIVNQARASNTKTVHGNDSSTNTLLTSTDATTSRAINRTSAVSGLSGSRYAKSTTFGDDLKDQFYQTYRGHSFQNSHDRQVPHLSRQGSSSCATTNATTSAPFTNHHHHQNFHQSSLHNGYSPSPHDLVRFSPSRVLNYDRPYDSPDLSRRHGGGMSYRSTGGNAEQTDPHQYNQTNHNYHHHHHHHHHNHTHGHQSGEWMDAPHNDREPLFPRSERRID